jgi:hypothetical protein
LAELTIPKEHQPILGKVRTMSEESLRALVSALGTSSEDASSIQGLSSEEAEEIEQVITELYDVRSYFDMDVPKFASEIAEGLREVEFFPDNELAAFKKRLADLLTIESVNIGAKAANLKREYPSRFCTARILTDARPIYSDDPSKPPTAAMITHTLRISYHDDTSRLREVYISMDGDDIATLHQILDRAEAKAKSLEAVLGSAKLKVLEQ